jgi:hypothetical protein
MNEQTPKFNQLLQALSVLHEALGKSANLQTSASRSINPPDLGVTIFLRDQRHSPRVTLVSPEDAPSIRRSTTNDLIYVVNKPSDQSTARWRSNGQSYVDLGGSVYIEVPGLLIDKRVNRRSRQKISPLTAADPFADKASNLCRWFLNHPPSQKWGIRELAFLTKVSLGTSSQVIRNLEKRGLLTVSRAGRRATVSIDNPTKLFNAWVAVYDWTRNPSLAVDAPIAEPTAFVKSLPRRLSSVVKKWALTLQAGAALVVTHATWERVHIYVDVSAPFGLKEIAARLGWQPAENGKLILMRPYYKRALWPATSTIGNLPVVDNLQLALDLWHYPVRGREQAQQILRNRLPWISSRDD